MNISKKAQKLYDMMETKTRDNGESYTVIKGQGHTANTPPQAQKLHDAIMEAHGDIFPCDWIYMQFNDLLGSIADYDIKTLDELENVRHEIIDNQVDIYTHELKQWLIDYPKADDFMSQAITSRSYVEDDGVWQVYSYAQYLAIDEIMNEVINLLSK